MSKTKGLNLAVNEKKRTVVVWLDNLSRELDDMFYKYGLYDEIHEFYPHIKERIVGKAVCTKDDIFDVEIGKKIAKAKFRKQYKASVRKAIDKLIADETKYIEKLKVFKEKFKEKNENEIISQY